MQSTVESSERMLLLLVEIDTAKPNSSVSKTAAFKARTQPHPLRDSISCRYFLANSRCPFETSDKNRRNLQISTRRLPDRLLYCRLTRAAWLCVAYRVNIGVRGDAHGLPKDPNEIIFAEMKGGG